MTSIYAKALIDIKREISQLEKMQYLTADTKAAAMTELLKQQKFISTAQEKARDVNNQIYREIAKMRAAEMELKENGQDVLG